MKIKPRPGDGKHAVKDGEWVGTIAFDYGFLHWETVWEHAKNAKLREKRPDPHVLAEGDELFIPELRPASHFKHTGERHVFTLPPRTQTFRLQLLDDHGEYLPDQAYEMKVECSDDAEFEQKYEKSDSHGWVVEEIPMTATKGTLKLSDHDHEMELHFGKLTPIDLADDKKKFQGTQERLKALGFYDGDVDGKDGPRLKAAIKAFQRFCRVNLNSGDPAILDPGPVDGIMGERTKAALLQYYGS